MPMGQYNLAPFNRLQNAGRDFEASYSMYATLTAVVAARVGYSTNYRYEASLDGEMTLGYGFSENYAMEAELNGSATPKVQINYKAKMESALTGQMNMAISAKYRLEAALTGSIEVAPDVWFAGAFYAALTGNFDSLQSSETEMRFDDLTIPAGSVLVIDSENFVVTLDGENVIDQYSGEWLFFDRSLAGLEASASSGGKLTVSALYRERYL